MPSLNELVAGMASRMASNGIGAGSIVPAAIDTPTPLPVAYCRKVIVQAMPTNTGKINVGNESAQPLELTAGERIDLEVSDASDVYITSAVAGEGAVYIVITAK